MTLGQIYQANPFVLSYELFPPKSRDGREALRTALRRLLDFEPHFITCTIRWRSYVNSPESRSRRT